LLKLKEVPGLTKWQKKRIAEELPQTKTINDLIGLMDPGTELRKIRWVGQKRAEQILECIDEFLS
jgi:hypothetical protein